MEILRKFVRVADDAGIDTNGRRFLVDKYKNAESRDFVLDGDLLGEITKSDIDTLLNILFNQEYISENFSREKEKLSFIGRLFFDFRKREKYEGQLTRDELGALSLMVKFLENFFQSGTFLVFVKNNRALVPNFTALVNTLAKIKEISSYDSQIQCFDRDRQDMLFQDVVNFVQDLIRQKKEEVLMSDITSAERGRRDGYLDHIEKIILDSAESLVDAYTTSPAGEMYLIKDCLIAASSTKGLPDFITEYSTGNEPPCLSLDTFDFDKGIFLPEQRATRHPRSRFVHYRKSTIIFAAFIVEYFKSHQQEDSL